MQSSHQHNQLKQVIIRTIKRRYISALRSWSHKKYSQFDLPVHSMFTSYVFWSSLGASIFRNSSSVANNTRSRLPSRLSFYFLWLCYKCLVLHLHAKMLHFAKIVMGKNSIPLEILWVFFTILGVTEVN